MKLDLIKACRNYEPIKKYCYDFQNEELTGKINGELWGVKKIDQRVVNWGNKKTIEISLHPEVCDTEYVGKCLQPTLLISNLNLEGDGGNMTSSENITIHTHPSNNQIISKGSYRVHHQRDGSMKIEISFKHDEKNYLNGYVVVKKET